MSCRNRRAGQGQQPHLSEHILQPVELGLPPHERAQLNRKVIPRHLGQPQRREPAGKITVHHLAHPHRARHTPQPMLAQVDELTALRKRVTDQFPGRARHQDLPAMARIHQPSRLVQHPPVVVIPPLLSHPRVQPHPCTQRRGRRPQLALQCPLCAHRPGKRSGRGRKHSMKPITGALDDVTTVGLDRAGDQLVMACQRPMHRARLLLPQRRRTLQIREEKRHSPRRKHAH